MSEDAVLFWVVQLSYLVGAVCCVLALLVGIGILR